MISEIVHNTTRGRSKVASSGVGLTARSILSVLKCWHVSGMEEGGGSGALSLDMPVNATNKQATGSKED